MLQLVQAIEQHSEFESMSAAEVEGFLCGVCAGPRPLSPGDWLPVIFGPSPSFKNDDQARTAYGLAARLHDGLARGIDDRDLSLEHLHDAAAWLQGLQNGFDISGDAWKPWVGKSVELEELLAPFFSLADHFGVGAAENVIPMEDEIRQAAIEALPQLLSEIHRFWRRTPLPETDTQPGATPS